jgi:hypothetical protein
VLRPGARQNARQSCGAFFEDESRPGRARDDLRAARSVGGAPVGRMPRR